MTLEKINVEKFIEDTRITEIDLDNCFQQQSSLRAYYGTVGAQYEAQANKLKAAFEYHEACLFKEYRDKFAEDGIKTTEKALENAVKMDKRWLSAKKQYIDAQCESDIAKALVASLIDRKDMLIQIGADRRDESKGQLRMMEIQKENSRLENLRERAQQVYQH